MSIRSKRAKVIASLGVVAAAGAVAGLGTFGAFTASTAPIAHDAATGVLSIALNGQTDSATSPVSIRGLQPGQSAAMPFDLSNAGTVDWASVRFESWATTSTLLDSDRQNGLQLKLQSCSTSWTPTAPTAYSCAGEVTGFYDGPVITTSVLTGADSLEVAGVDHLLATITLPAHAGQTMQNLASGVSFGLTAVQRDGTAR